MNDMIRVIIVDDHIHFRDAVAEILDRDPEIHLVGQGGTAEEAIRLTRDLAPDILLLDIGMPGGGLLSAKKVVRDYPATKVIMLTASADEDNILKAFHIGVCAYVLKGVSGRDLLNILHDVFSGHCFQAPVALAGYRTDAS